MEKITFSHPPPKQELITVTGTIDVMPIESAPERWGVMERFFAAPYGLIQV